MFGTYIGNGKMLVKTRYNGMLTLPSDDLGLMPPLVSNGSFEEPLTKYFMNTIKPKDVVVDVGANYGYFTLLAGLLTGTEGHVYAYEPSARIATYLQDNVNMNYINTQTTVSQKAVHSEMTELEFFTAERYSVNSSLHKRPTYEKDFDDTYISEKVQTTTLEHDLKQYKTIRLVKMDIEGGEYHAVLGMKSLLEQGIVENLVFEWNVEPLGENVDAFISLLQSLDKTYGYRLHKINADGIKQPIHQVNYQELKNIAWYPYFVFSKL